MELCTVESTSEWLCLGESLIRLKLKKINHKLGRVERLYTCAKDSLSFKSFSFKKKGEIGELQITRNTNASVKNPTVFFILFLKL